MCIRLVLVLVAFSFLSLQAASIAAPPWSSLTPFKRIEADPNKSYTLTENQGPWVILAASFMQEDADEQAHNLVLELRKRFKMKAYVHHRDYDFTKRETGLGLDRYGRPKRMKYVNESKFTATAGSR